MLCRENGIHSQERTLSVFRGFSRLLDAILGLATAITELAKVQRQSGPAADRLTALELSRHQFEAQMEGLFLKADGKLKAASNAEARERQLRKSYEHLIDPLAEDGEEGKGNDAVLPIHAAAGGAEGMHPLRLDVAADPKAAAVNAKWAQ